MEATRKEASAPGCFFFTGGGSEEICFLLGDDVFFPETHSGFLGIFPDLSLPCNIVLQGQGRVLNLPAKVSKQIKGGNA